MCLSCLQTPVQRYSNLCAQVVSFVADAVRNTWSSHKQSVLCCIGLHAPKTPEYALAVCSKTEQCKDVEMIKQQAQQRKSIHERQHLDDTVEVGEASQILILDGAARAMWPRHQLMLH